MFNFQDCYLLFLYKRISLFAAVYSGGKFKFTKLTGLSALEE
jgi:hypothetical protein